MSQTFVFAGSRSALAEKCQLEAVLVPIGCCQISRRVPPLGLKIFMIEVIPRKFVMITRQGGLVLPGCSGQKNEEKREEKVATLHEWPPGDSGLRPRAPD